MKSNLVTPAKKCKFSMRLFTEAISYRVPLPVTKVIVFTHNNTYPVCPRCSICLDREYMSFCDQCGQKLGWDLFKYAKSCYPGSQKE